MTANQEDGIRWYSYSELQDFAACPTKWQWRWQWRLQPSVKDDRMLAGTYVHDLLARYWLLPVLQRNPMEIYDWLGEGPSNRAAIIAEDLMASYISQYSIDVDIQPVWTEQTLHWKINKAMGIKGVIDAWQPPYLVETKTGHSNDIHLATLDGQSLLYQWIASQNENKDLASHEGTMFNIITTTGCKRYVTNRTYGERHKAAELFRDLALRLWEHEDKPAILQWNNEKGVPYLPMALNYGCSHCDYRHLCTEVLTGGDPEQLIEKDFVKEEHHRCHTES